VFPPPDSFYSFELATEISQYPAAGTSTPTRKHRMDIPLKVNIDALALLFTIFPEMKSGANFPISKLRSSQQQVANTANTTPPTEYQPGTLQKNGNPGHAGKIGAQHHPRRTTPSTGSSYQQSSVRRN
jgi:hypothetical protein